MKETDFGRHWITTSKPASFNCFLFYLRIYYLHRIAYRAISDIYNCGIELYLQSRDKNSYENY